jgi:hypothetical protein
MDWNSQRGGGGRPRRNLGGGTTEKEPLKKGQTWNKVKNWLRIGSNGRLCRCLMVLLEVIGITMTLHHQGSKNMVLLPVATTKISHLAFRSLFWES